LFLYLFEIRRSMWGLLFGNGCAILVRPAVAKGRA